MLPKMLLAWETARENLSEYKECRKHVASNVQNIDSASVSGSELMGGTIWGFHFDEFKISFSSACYTQAPGSVAVSSVCAAHLPPPSQVISSTAIAVCVLDKKTSHQLPVSGGGQQDPARRSVFVY